MPTVFTHGLVAITLGQLSPFTRPGFLFWSLSILCACLPDADVLAFNFNIPYNHWLGHRGFFHSLPFALALGFVVMLGFYRGQKWWAYWLYFSLVTASHGLFDAMTTGGLGVGFFIPFDDTRYFLPYRFIKVSPIGVQNFFSEWGWKVMLSEWYKVWIPCCLILVFVLPFRYYWDK